MTATAPVHWEPERGDAEAPHWQEHMRVCARCQARWQAWKGLETLLGHAPPEVAPPPDLALQVQARLIVAAQEQQRQVRLWARRMATLLAALLVPWGYLTLWFYPRAARAFLARVMLARWWVAALWDVFEIFLPSPWGWVLLSLGAWVLTFLLAGLWWRWMHAWWRASMRPSGLRR